VLTHGSLFAGIGGFDLGFERAGIKTLWQVEIDEWCRKLLAQRFPEAQQHGDINECFPELTSSAADSPVRTFPTPASAPELPEPVLDSGGQWCVPFAWYDRATQLWRTWQLCLDGEWAEFSETWPRAGMTRNGIAYQRPPLVPRTAAIESSSSDEELWTTPCATDTITVKAQLRPSRIATGRKTDYLARQALMRPRFPTPRANERGQYQRDRGEKGKERPTLTGVAKGWPTPRSSANENRQTKRTPSQEAGNHGLSLAAEVGGQLNPMWVEWLMGFPLGWTALEDSETPLSRKSRNGLQGKS
jgi:hypothetical protein